MLNRRSRRSAALSTKSARNHRRPNTQRRKLFGVEPLEARALLTTGMLDPTFGTGGLVTTDFLAHTSGGDYAQAAVAQGSKVLVGVITLASVPDQPFGGVTQEFKIVRYNADGTVDNSFGTEGQVRLAAGPQFYDSWFMPQKQMDLQLQADGKIVVAHSAFSGTETGWDYQVTRLNLDGTLDDGSTTDSTPGDSFGVAGKTTVNSNIGSAIDDSDYVRGLALDATGRIVVAGVAGRDESATGYAPLNDFIFRLQSNGSLDTSFSGDGSAAYWPLSFQTQMADVIVQADGKIVYASGAHVVRLDPAGAVDLTFGTTGSIELGGSALALDSQGRIVVAGGAIVRLTSNGAYDATFATNGVQSSVYGANVAVQPDDKIVVVNNYNFTVSRLDQNGAPDSGFGTGGSLSIDFGSTLQIATAVAVQGNDIVVVGVSGSDVDMFQSDAALAKVSTAGVLLGQVTTDLPYIAPGAVDGLPSSAQIAVQADGKILVAGASQGGGSSGDFAIARYNANGTPDLAFGYAGRVLADFNYFNSGDYARAVAVQPDGKIVVVGIAYVGGVGSDIGIVRLNSDGTLDTTFDGDGRLTIDFGPDDRATRVAIHGNQIIVAGNSGTNAVVARINVIDGQLDSNFGDQGKQLVNFPEYFDTSLALQGDKVVLLGHAPQAENEYDFVVARLTAAGQPDLSFGSAGLMTIDFNSPNDFSAAVEVDALGNIVVVGTTYPVDAPYGQIALARIASDGQVEKHVIDTGSDMGLNGLALQVDGKIVVSGPSQVARLTSNGTLDTTYHGTGLSTIDFGSASGLVLQSDGGIVVAGATSTYPNRDFAVARFIGNTAPVAANDQVIVGQGSSNNVLAVLENDQDPDGDALTIQAVGPTARGATVMIEPTSKRMIFYTPRTPTSTGIDTFTYTAVDPFGATSTRQVTVTILANTVVVEPVNLQTEVLAQQTTTTEPLDVVMNVTPTSYDAVIQAVNTLSPVPQNGQTVYVTLAVSDGIYHGTVISPPKGVVVILNGSGGTTTFIGASPALTVTSGEVLVTDGVVLTNSTDAPTILVTGGHLTVRNSTIEESTNFNRAAIQITGGTVDLGTTDSLGGNTFIIHGTGDFIVNSSSDLALAVGNQYLIDDTLVTDINTATAAMTGSVTFTPAAAYGLSFGSVATSWTANAMASPVSVQVVDQFGLAATSNAEVTIALGNNPASGVLGGTLTAAAVGGSAVFDDLSIDAVGAGYSLVATAPGLASAYSNNFNVAANGAPSAADDNATTKEDAPVTINALGNDGDPDGQTLTVTSFTQPSRGTVVLNANGTFTYMPGAAIDGAGTDSFTYTISDGHAGSDTATVNITIEQYAGVTKVAGILRVGGTGGNDVVAVSGGNLIVNGAAHSLAGVSEVRVWGRGGHDNIDLTGLGTKAFIHGGAGNDTLVGGSADDVIFGGAGDDALTGAAGHDFLIGGDGKDRLVGSAGHDILVAGEVANQFDLAMLWLISQDWASSHTVAIDGVDDFVEEVEGDDDYDVLTGGAGADLFIINGGDKITDYQFGKPKTNKDGDVVIRDGEVVA